MQSLKHTPLEFSALLQANNLSREQFVALYQPRSLVSVPQLPAATKSAFLGAYGCIFFLALLGNSLVLYLVIGKKALRSVHNIFICSLALSDLMTTTFCIPFTILQNVYYNWKGGAFACKMVPFVQVTAIAAEILTMVCLAVERYQGVVHPLKIKWQCTRRRAFIVLGVVWLAAAVFGSPMWYVQALEIKYDYLYDQHYVCCFEQWVSPLHRKIFTTFILVILFLLPLTLMTVMYGKISYELWIKKRVGNASVTQTFHGTELSKRKKKRAVTMMVTVVVLFAVCWTPFHVAHMMMEYSNFEHEHDDDTLQLIFGIIQITGFFNSICNPIVYGFMSEKFRRGFLSSICAGAMKITSSRPRHLRNSRIATVVQEKLGSSKRTDVIALDHKREVFDGNNIDIKVGEQLVRKKNFKKKIAWFDTDATEASVQRNVN
ncbi:pyroglutamylated RF-amide peptide receptor [Latimeria chalumnae]|uniref:pyroglutamylated RF-amide peptide receptor n=1 Tax=Latimeria chalumnae TaxID=7897 RepID=UPI0006D91047|nr:PREDICTED: pyroglutamylated RFamide peptide receptor [Latimeria chalumnae]|eukprot:XP_014345916.1 PREDICTED: pyroglutamylated RFamide peptide receptor [Latimeria chalumnae]